MLPLLIAVTGCAGAPPGPAWASPDAPLLRLEEAYQAAQAARDRLNLTLALGASASPEGTFLAKLREDDSTTRTRFHTLLDQGSLPRLGRDDSLAIQAMREGWERRLAVPPEGAGLTTAPAACPPVSDTLDSLTAELMACFTRAADLIVVDGDSLNRLAILGRLGRIDDQASRRRLFLALAPVWESVNGDNRRSSPYRRLVALRRLAWGTTGSPVQDKGPALGLAADTVEQWLTRTLERWRSFFPDSLVEPWDWYYENGAAGRLLATRIRAVEAIRAVNDSFYRALGADPESLGVRYDLEPRPGKYPLAFTDFGRRARFSNGKWEAGEPWVSASYLSGGLDNLAELLHESGHAVHIAAIRTRPAFLDWPDNDTFTEALADVPALEAQEPRWQQRFLGDSAPTPLSIRSRYAALMMDMAWALFEMKVHGDGNMNPDSLWAGLTQRYLGIRPHPEWSWWAMRGQLIDAPGYLINYALGAFITADLRRRVAAACPGCLEGNERYYPFASGLLYRFGRERTSQSVLDGFLGRPFRPEALLQDMARVRPAGR